MLETLGNFVVDWTYRQYQRFGYWIYVPPSAITLLLAIFFIHGCIVARQRASTGGVDAETWKKIAEAAAEEPGPLAPKPVPKPLSSKPTAARAVPSQPTAVARAGKEPPGKLATPLPPVVDNLADWKRDDFLRARADGDPRLGDAIAALGRRTVGNQAAAALLVSLLGDPPAGTGTPPPKPGGAAKPPSKPPVAQVVAALAANGTDAARAALREIASGRVAMQDSLVAAAAAMIELARGGDPDDETLLFTAMTAPEQLLPPALTTAQPEGPAASAGARAAAEELRNRAADAVKSSGSVAVRLRLARFLVQPDTLPGVRQRLVECLMDPRGENIQAQTLLYGCEELDPKVRDVLERRFAAWSAAALAQALGLPASQATAATAPLTASGSAAQAAAPPASAPAASAEVEPAHAIHFLWNKELVNIVVRRLELASSLEQALGPLKLAGVTPCPASRAAIREMLHEHMYEITAASNYAPGWFDTVVDPGLLVVFKELPRKGLPERPAAPVRRGSKGTAKPVRVPPAEQIKQEHALTEEWWILRSFTIAQNWCGRLFRAALAAPERSPALTEEIAKDFPELVRRDGHTIAAYHCPWPGRLEGKLPPAARDALDVYYLRIKEKARPDSVISDYRRLLTASGATATKRTMPRCLWLDVFGDGAAAGRKRSIDVFVSKAAENAPALLDAESDLMIEVLMVEGADSPPAQTISAP